MDDVPGTLASIPGICELTVHRPAGPARAWLLVEVPHGATRRADYDAVCSLMTGTLPAQLEHFFFVNTDVGAPEGADWLGQTLGKDGIGVVVARCLVPRTFIDTNRVLASDSKGGQVVDGITPGVPGYIDQPEDIARLVGMHRAYHALVAAAYEQVCGQGRGLALQLHSYSPRSVNIEKTDGGIVEALHKAYVPEVYATWPERPAVDLISALADDSFRTAPKLVAALRAAYAEAGIAAEENATYHLHPATMGLHYARAYPDQVLCVELNRGLVADPFVPFGVSPISEAKVARMVAPIARVLAEALRTR